MLFDVTVFEFIGALFRLFWVASLIGAITSFWVVVTSIVVNGDRKDGKCE